MDTKKKRTPNQKKKAIVSVLLMVAILITGAFAFLSATDSKTNVFTVGNVKIKLSEEFDTNQNGSIEKTNDENDEVYDASETQVSLKGEILPGQKVIKRPYVENTGKNKAWVYITVGIPTTNSNNTFRNKDTGETSITGQNVDIPIQAYAIQENYANKTTYKDVWNAYFADKVTDTFGAEVTDAKTLSERVPLFEILNETRFNEPIPDNISVDDNIPNDDWENIGITVGGQEKSYYKSANYDYYVFAYKTLLDPTADGAEQLSRTSDVFEGVRLLKDIGEAQPSKLNYYIKETAGNTLNGEVDLSVEPSTYDGYRLVKTEYYMPGERVRNLYYDDTLAETGYSFNWNFMNDKTKSAYSGMTITQDTDLVATYKDTVSDDSKEPTEVPVVKYSPSGYLGYAIEQNDDESYYATLIGADETRSDCPKSATEVIVPSHVIVGMNTDGTKCLSNGVLMHGSLNKINVGISIPVKKIQLAEWQWNPTTNTEAASEALALGRIAKKLNISGTNIEEIKFCGDIYQHNITSGFVLEDVGTLPSSLTTLNDKAFYCCVNLKSCTLPNSLVTIGNSAFNSCTSLKDVNLSESIAQIDNYAFSYCSNLTSILVPNKVARIGKYTFLNCSKLANIVIANNVETIEEGTFQGCENLTSITIPNSVTGIGDSAFLGCTGLTGITIPENVTSIGNNIFFGCTGLTSVAIPNSVTNIGMQAFIDCVNLTNVTIPDGVLTIKDSTFSDCDNITDIKIPDSVTSIGYNAFRHCDRLANVTIGSGVTNIGYEAFAWCNSLANITVYENNKKYASKDGILYTKDFSELLLYPAQNVTENLVLPEGLKKISDNAFSNNNYIKTIYIPSTVTEIGNSIINNNEIESITISSDNSKYDSRNNCNAIIETATNTLIEGCKNTIIPNGVTRIGVGAFGGCSDLTNITIPDSITNIEMRAFSGCTGLTSITIPDSVIYISIETFRDCTSLTSVAIGNGVTKIYDWAFNSCTNLTSITIPDSVKSIGSKSFAGCSNLANITIPNSVTSIGDEAFGNCDFKTINLPEGIISIGSLAFFDCRNLTNVTIPKSVTNISGDVFAYCESLTSINVSDKNTVYDSRNNCNAIIETATNTLIAGCKNTVIPDDVTNIGQNAFEYCKGLTSITIPNSVTSIGDGAFYGCADLIDIMIPDSVANIGNYAFSGCAGLTNIIIPDGVTSIGQSTFENCSGLTNVIIPDSVAKIGYSAFSYCDSLKSITYQGTVSDWAKVDCPPGSFASGLTITCTDGTVTTQ